MQSQVVNYSLGLVLFAGLALQVACSREQLKANTYEALHKREQIKCREAGRKDCLGYESYPEYEQKRKEVEQETK